MHELWDLREIVIPVLVLSIIWYKTKSLAMIFLYVLVQVAWDNDAVPKSKWSFAYPLWAFLYVLLYITLDKLTNMCAAQRFAHACTHSGLGPTRLHSTRRAGTRTCRSSRRSCGRRACRQK